MGFVSKQEDETERRGGYAIAPGFKSYAHIEGLVREGVTKLHFTEEKNLEFHGLIERIKVTGEAMAQSALPFGEIATSKRLNSFLKRKQFHRDAISALIQFLAPEVRSLKQGLNKRQWQKLVATLKRYRAQ